MVGPQAHPLTRALDALRTDLLAIVQAGIRAVDGGSLTERSLESLAEGFPPHFQAETAAIQIVAAGKAAGPMAAAATRALGDRVHGGIVIAPHRAEVPPLEAVAAGHPTPDAASERAGRRALEIAGSLAGGDALLVLLSGGASSLMAAPAEGISLDDKRATTSRLLLGGAEIHALNTVRKHLSAIKGGWLAAIAKAPCHALVISDVVGDDLSVIASGPTVPDATTFADALEVLRRFGGIASYPVSVARRLDGGARGMIAETPKPGDVRLTRTSAVVIGGRCDAMTGAARQAERRGYHVLRIDDAIVGEARVTSVAHVRAMLARASSIARPACIISSGETVVRVVGRGTGGRNQEFALASAALLASAGSPAALASVGTDGTDGPTDAAGAMADSTTVSRALAAGIDNATDHLDDNNAYAFFDAIGDLIRIGPTDTNVGDLQVLLIS